MSAISRRQFLRGSAVAAALPACRTLWASDEQQRPNLLVIHTDEHNFRTLGCYRARMPKAEGRMWGETVVETPNIDWLAARGALCTRFYATTPVCSPSRGAFVSGRYPQNTPVTTNNIPMADDIVTFAEVLRRRGYATGYAGKWHLDGTGKPQWAPRRTFGFEDNRFLFNRGHWKQLEETPDGPRVKARGAGGKPTYRVEGADAKSFTTDFLADRTVAFIEAHKDKPFCYMVSIPDPHGPNTVRPPYDTMFDPAELRAPATVPKSGQAVPSWGGPQRGRFSGKQMALYCGMVKCIDDNVGKILDALRRCGTLDRTIVVFTADHGDLCGEHGRHNKGVPYEGSAKIPFVLYYPRKVAAGTVVTRALSCVDFLPTILGLMGVQAPKQAEGRDASALLMGKTPGDWKDIVFLRGTGRRGTTNWLAAVTSRHKLVFSPTGEPWLFDLEKHPDEMRNFLRDNDCREVVRDLARAIAGYCTTYRDPYAQAARIRADLTWAIEGTGAYAPPADAGRAVPTPRAGRRAGRRKARTRDATNAPARDP